MSTSHAAVPVVTLTDEEIAALDPTPADQRLVPLRIVDALDPLGHDVAVATALRGLAARGWVSVINPDQVKEAVESGSATASVSVELSEHLATVLTLRTSSVRIVVAQRDSAASSDILYLYDGPDDVALAELLEPNGMHRFAVTESAGIAEALVEFLVPSGWDGGPSADGAVVEDLTVPVDVALAGRGAVPVLESLGGDAAVLSTFLMRRPGPPPAQQLLSVVHAGPAALRVGLIPQGSPDPVTFRAVDRAGLVAWVGEQLA